MEKDEKIKIEDLLKQIDKEFPKISLKSISDLEEFVRNEKLEKKTVKDLSFFLLDYDKRSVENNTKYGFPESDFEDYKNRDLFLVRIYKELAKRYEKENKDTEVIREFLRLGGQKVHDRKVPFRCLRLGRLDYEDSYEEFKDYSRFYQDMIKKYDKGFKFTESDNTKAYIDNKNTRKANVIKLIIVIAIVLGVLFIGKVVGDFASKYFDNPKVSNETIPVETNEIR